MYNYFLHLDLNNFPKIDKNTRKDDVIKARKFENNLTKESRTKSKLNNCYYCGKLCDSFCNSHTLPAFCLRNIAHKGKIFYWNTIIRLPSLNEDKGINESGTFQLICRECDSKIFQEYENPDNYENIPSVKMLAQIDMKNNLKSISKRLIEIEKYNLMKEQMSIDKQYIQEIQTVNHIDLAEFESSFRYAKKRNAKPFSGDYYVGFYKKLPYTVPIAFQGTVALTFDLEGNVINNVFNKDSKYIVRNMGVCIFPLKQSSVVMLFVDKNNSRYNKFFRQLRNRDKDLEDQLSIINYILFYYEEDYFLSPNLDKKVLEKLNSLASKTQEMLAPCLTTYSQQLEEVRKQFDYSERSSTPNLLSHTFALPKEYINE